MNNAMKKAIKHICECGKKNKQIVAGVIIVLILLGAGAYYYKQKKSDIGLEGAQTKVLEFVNGTLLSPDNQATLVDAAEENDLYRVTIKVGDQEIPTYISRDGQKFFPQAMDTVSESASTAGAPAEEQKEIPKTDKPTVDLYVMSFCPFGNQAEDTLKPVYDLLKNKVDFNFHYIVSSNGDKIQSLHGDKEVVQDEREACVLKNYGKDKWIAFATYVNANCGSDGTCWEAGANSLGLSTAKISACVNSEGTALMKENEAASNAAGAQGSPTMVVNGVETNVVYQYGNSESYKQAICDAFNTAPSECSKTLSAQTSTAQGGSCD